jgi:hypothetical protein
MRTESSSSHETLRAAPLRAALRSVPRSTGIIDLLLVHFSDRSHGIETSVSSLATAFETVRSAVDRLVAVAVESGTIRERLALPATREPT